MVPRTYGCQSMKLRIEKRYLVTEKKFPGQNPNFPVQQRQLEDSTRFPRTNHDIAGFQSRVWTPRGLLAVHQRYTQPPTLNRPSSFPHR